MKVQQILRTSTATAALGLAMVAQSAFAQQAGPTPPPVPDNDSGVIIVTGSLIQNPNLESSSPVNVTDAEEISLRQSTNAELLLRETPGVVPSVGQNTNNGNGGASFVDLRGLGTNRNLVMLNSTRITPANVGGAVDLNNIPVALIERVDVLTGGASTTYGADAVTGVVNFITRRDFAGLDLALTQEISEEGDANRFRADLVLGANFDDGRGNAVLALGYIEADPLFFGERDLGQCTVNSISGTCGGDSPTSTPTSFAFAAGNQQVSPAGDRLVPQYTQFNFNPFNLYQTPFERFNIYGQSHYDINDRITVYGRGLFSKNTVNTIVGPSGVFGEPLVIAANNPFLNATIRDQLCVEAGIAPGAPCAARTGFTTTTGIPITVYRRAVEVGPRVSTYTTTIFDVKAGATVNLLGNIDFDIYGAYGESENDETRSGYVARSRLQQALNATSATTCAVATNGCVPLNLFGQPGSITPAMAGFIGGVTSTITRFSTLSQVRAQIGGDTGITLLGAEPVAFAIGAEQRKYTAGQNPDNLAQVPGELGGAGGAILKYAGAYRARDAFGELIVPIISDRPFFDELTIEGGVRFSWYDIEAAGNPSFDATSWKVGASWTPVPAVTLRGNYQKAVRAPSILELFQPPVTVLTNLATDPCAGAAPVTNANLRAVCLAQGAPVASIGVIQNPAAGQANRVFSGSTALTPETAKTFTAGIVLNPGGLIPGFSASLDYYRIRVTDAINAPLPGDVIAACFGNLTAASAADPRCTGIRRNPATGRLSGSPTTTPGLPTPLTNAGILFTSGWDLIMDYRTDLGFADLRLNFSGNYTENASFDASAINTGNTFPNCPGVFSPNCGISSGQLQPEFSWSQRTTLDFGDIDLSLLWRHISSFQQETGGFYVGPLLSGGPNFTTTRTNPFLGQRINANYIPSYDYFDFTARFQATSALSITGTVFNLFDKAPPILGGNVGSTSANGGNTYPATYDVVGRRFSVTARLTF